MTYPKTLPEDRLAQATKPATQPTTKGARASIALNSAQRNTVRIALATGATVAALIGAQTLALANRATGQIITLQAANALVTAAPVINTTSNTIQSPTVYATPNSVAPAYSADVQSAAVQPAPRSRASS